MGIFSSTLRGIFLSVSFLGERKTQPVRSAKNDTTGSIVRFFGIVIVALLVLPNPSAEWCHGGRMTVTMASRNRCTYVAGGDSNSSFVCRSTESESDVVATSDRAFLIGVAGGTASGKVIGSK